jgi:mRNA-degrading endonuclease RelE of RelBE toxin-antitoxin system
MKFSIEVRIADTVRVELRELPIESRRAVNKAVDLLKKDLRGNLHPLKSGPPYQYRLKVGKVAVLFRYSDDVVTVYKVRGSYPRRTTLAARIRELEHRLEDIDDSGELILSMMKNPPDRISNWDAVKREW